MWAAQGGDSHRQLSDAFEPASVRLAGCSYISRRPVIRPTLALGNSLAILMVGQCIVDGFRLVD